MQISQPSHRRTLLIVTSIIAFVAVGVWIGGLVTLGAIVAPTVFRMVPAPTSADAMTVVFRKFDSLAMVCAAAVLIVEVARISARVTGGRLSLVRGSCATVGVLAAVYQAISVSPRIAALHDGGAVRGFGPDGLSLDAVHRVATLNGKVQVFAGLAIVVLHVVDLMGPKPPHFVGKSSSPVR